MNQLENLFYDLISINSGNLNYSENASGEKEIGDFLYNYFKKNNIDCKKQKVLDDRNNIIAKIEGKRSKEAILFCPHLDTVYIEGMDFKPKLRQGKVFGPGTCDTKASLAAMVNAFIELKKHNLDTPDLYFAGLISEEILHLGIKIFLKEFNNFTAAVIGEPTNLNIGYIHKGQLRIKINAKGRCAHGSTPDIGVNAIYNIEKLIHELRTKLIPSYNDKYNKTFGKPTLNVGIIHGGTGFNVVPDYCSIELDRRIIPGEVLEDIINEFRKIIKYLKDKEEKFSAEIESSFDYIPCLRTDKKEKIVNIAYNSTLKFFKNAKIKSLPYTTDGGFLSELKIPTIVLGPGDVKVCHQLGEYVEVEQLLAASKIYKDICLNF